MSSFEEAVSWSGRGVTLSMFAVFSADGPSAALEKTFGEVALDVRVYKLEDVDARLGGRECHEYDLALHSMPPDIESCLTAWTRAALDSGAEVAWFAFEGSFDFDHILTADVAGQVFAVGSGAGVELAIEDSIRTAPTWAARIVDVRAKSGL